MDPDEKLIRYRKATTTRSDFCREKYSIVHFDYNLKVVLKIIPEHIAKEDIEYDHN